MLMNTSNYDRVSTLTLDSRFLLPAWADPSAYGRSTVDVKMQFEDAAVRKYGGLTMTFRLWFANGGSHEVEIAVPSGVAYEMALMILKSRQESPEFFPPIPPMTHHEALALLMGNPLVGETPEKTKAA